MTQASISWKRLTACLGNEMHTGYPVIVKVVVVRKEEKDAIQASPADAVFVTNVEEQ